jgi:hypothetical protein
VRHAFLIVVVIVGVVGIIGAAIALAMSRGTWESLGRDRLLMESDLRDPRAPARPAARRPGAPPPVSPGGEAEREAEIRQMVEALDARRRTRRPDRPPLDVDAVVADLLAAPPADLPAAPPADLPAAPPADLPAAPPADLLAAPPADLLAAPPAGEPAPRSDVDPELVAEIRQLVIARNHRRARRGRPPLDVEAEIARQIARLNG